MEGDDKRIAKTTEVGVDSTVLELPELNTGIRHTRHFSVGRGQEGVNNKMSRWSESGVEF